VEHLYKKTLVMDDLVRTAREPGDVMMIDRRRGPLISSFRASRGRPVEGSRTSRSKWIASCSIPWPVCFQADAFESQGSGEPSRKDASRLYPPRFQPRPASPMKS
jgi:hypothetical protein